MNDREMTVLAAGGLLLASGLQRAETATLRSSRASVIRRVDVVRHTWWRRISHTGATISIVAGGLLVTYAFLRQRTSRQPPTAAALAPSPHSADTPIAQHGEPDQGHHVSPSRGGGLLTPPTRTVAPVSDTPHEQRSDTTMGTDPGHHVTVRAMQTDSAPR